MYTSDILTAIKHVLIMTGYDFSMQKSKALYDAEKCIELKPSWSKAYIRLGAGMHDGF